MNEGQVMYELAGRLFPICRSIMGEGFRQSLDIIREVIPDLKVRNVPSGTTVFDWNIPKEWNIRGGGIYRLNGEKVVDFKDSNLHIMGYSIPVNKVVNREELMAHIYTQQGQPDWIPYVTSYYKERWGFCMSENQKQSLQDKDYKVEIDSSLEEGYLTFGELIIPGETKEEIFFSTYLCHPSMANNELSGPVLLTELIKYVRNLKNHRYTYRFVFIPETIGSLTYCSLNLEALQKNVKAGFVLSCVGDDRDYSYIASRYGNTLADKVLKNVLKYHTGDNYTYYSYLKRGSDERQYCSPGIDLPVVGFCRTKYGVYPEYHTSADNMDLISPVGLQGAYDVMVKVINALEYNHSYRILCKGEPQLGKRGLYPTVSQKGSSASVRVMRDFLAYADGDNDLLDISYIINQPIDILIPVVDNMVLNDLIITVNK